MGSSAEPERTNEIGNRIGQWGYNLRQFADLQVLNKTSQFIYCVCRRVQCRNGSHYANCCSTSFSTAIELNYMSELILFATIISLSSAARVASPIHPLDVFSEGKWRKSRNNYSIPQNAIITPFPSRLGKFRKNSKAQRALWGRRRRVCLSRTQ